MLAIIPNEPVDVPPTAANVGRSLEVDGAARIRKKIVTRYRPTSVLQLLLIGFALVALPLGAGLIVAFVSVDLLSKESEQAVLNAAKAVKAGEKLSDQITQMERNVRQYLVLGDQAIYGLAVEQREPLREATGDLLTLDLTDELRDRITRLLAIESSVFEVLDQAAHDSEPSKASAEAFGEMTSLARGLSSHITWLIARYTEDLRDHATRLQNMVAWLATLMVLAAFGLAAWVAVLLAKPIRQVEDAIRRLGEGKFEGRIQVHGPRDLEDLGDRLDWLRKRLLELEEQKANFLRHVSHELKTPLTAIREGSELLRDQVPGPMNAEQAEVAGILRENSIRLQRLIEDLLSYSMSPPAVSTLTAVPVDLEQVARRVVSDHELAIRTKDLDVTLNLSPVCLHGEAEKLRAIVDNLLSNAIKYSPKRGRVSIEIRADHEDAVIEVADQGPGVSSAERDKVFQPFYQGQARYRSHVKGTGLGLAIARDNVQAHGGVIQILDSQRGARFQVRLPLRDGMLAECPGEQ